MYIHTGVTSATQGQRTSTSSTVTIDSLRTLAISPQVGRYAIYRLEQDHHSKAPVRLTKLKILSSR